MMMVMTMMMMIRRVSTAQYNTVQAVFLFVIEPPTRLLDSPPGLSSASTIQSVFRLVNEPPTRLLDSPPGLGVSTIPVTIHQSEHRSQLSPTGRQARNVVTPKTPVTAPRKIALANW